MAEIVRALQGEVLDVPHVTASAVSEMWARAAAGLDRELELVDLATLAKRQAEFDTAASPVMYYI